MPAVGEWVFSLCVCCACRLNFPFLPWDVTNHDTLVWQLISRNACYIAKIASIDKPYRQLFFRYWVSKWATTKRKKKQLCDDPNSHPPKIPKSILANKVQLFQNFTQTHLSDSKRAAVAGRGFHDVPVVLSLFQFHDAHFWPIGTLSFEIKKPHKIDRKLISKIQNSPLPNKLHVERRKKTKRCTSSSLQPKQTEKSPNGNPKTHRPIAPNARERRQMVLVISFSLRFLPSLHDGKSLNMNVLKKQVWGHAHTHTPHLARLSEIGKEEPATHFWPTFGFFTKVGYLLCFTPRPFRKTGLLVANSLPF